MEEGTREIEPSVVPFMAKLEVVENGLILTGPDGHKQVFAQQDDFTEEHDLAPVPDALYAMLECLGLINNKWAKHRVEIHLQHGREYECKDKDCPICKKK